MVQFHCQVVVNITRSQKIVITYSEFQALYSQMGQLKNEERRIEQKIGKLRADRIQSVEERLAQIPPLEAKKEQIQSNRGALLRQIQESELDPYELMGVEPDATLKELEYMFALRYKFFSAQESCADDLASSMRNSSGDRGDFDDAINDVVMYEDLGHRLSVAYEQLKQNKAEQVEKLKTEKAKMLQGKQRKHWWWPF